MRPLWLVPVLALTLTACSGEPRDELRGDVEAVTLAANDRDAAGLRSAVTELRSTIRAQVASGELERGEGERLNAIAVRLLENADLLDEAEPSPAPEPTVEPSPEPEPTVEPSPEPTEEEDDEPEPDETVEIEVPPVGEESPPAQSQGGGEPSPETSPAA